MYNNVIPVAANFEHAVWPAPDVGQRVREVTGIAMDFFGLPFDVARAQYARAVEVGLLQRSMLASRDFSRAVSACEQLTLGPWARHV